MAVDLTKHCNSHEANQMSVLGQLGKDLALLDCLRAWPLASEARAQFLDDLRSKAASILYCAGKLSEQWKDQP